MTSRQPPHESRGDRVEESDRNSGKQPMEKFRSLTKSIIGVTRAQIREQERRNEADRMPRRKAI